MTSEAAKKRPNGKQVPRLMKLSTRARYALRMMVEMARLSSGEVDLISLAELSDVTRISRRYLEQLAIVLKNNALIRGKTGKGGGYCLGRKPEDITVAEIIETAIGPINIVDCVLDPETCPMADECGCRSVYCDINSRIVDSLQSLTLAELARNHRVPRKLKDSSARAT